MARRPPRRTGSSVFRRAVLADMRRVQRHFPTAEGAARLAAVESGAAVAVSAGRLFRGLHTLAPDVADLFRHTPGRAEPWFTLDEHDVLTEQAESLSAPAADRPSADR